MKTFEEALQFALDLDNTLGDNKNDPKYRSHLALKDQMQANLQLVRWMLTLELQVVAELLPAIAAQDAKGVHDILHAAIGSTLEVGIVIGMEMEKQELDVNRFAL